MATYNRLADEAGAAAAERPSPRRGSVTLSRIGTLAKTLKGRGHRGTVTGIPERINEEEWQVYVKPTGLIFPAGKLKFRWDLLVLSLIFYSCISVPMRLGFDVTATGGWWAWEVVVSLVFLADLVLVFHTAYVEGDQCVAQPSALPCPRGHLPFLPNRTPVGDAVPADLSSTVT